jgi:pimeloyl-ACP methyl ester carboxylesterase
MEGVPETSIARLGGDRIAYQVVGEGPVDLVFMPATGQAIDVMWEYPPLAEWLHRLASFSRLIAFDRRGTGASDPAPAEEIASWERWAEDARGVLDAVASERAVIFGATDGGPTAILFAATQPARTLGLVLANTSARFLKDTDYPSGADIGDLDGGKAFVEEAWGTEAMASFGGSDLGADHAYAA